MKIFQNISLSIFSKILVLLLSFFVFSFLGKNLDKSDFGEFSFLLSISTPLIAFMSFGMHLSSSKMINKLDSSTLKVFSILTFILTSFFGLIFFGMSTFIFSFISLGSFVFIYFFSFFSSILRIASDYFRASDRFSFFLIFNSYGTGSGVIFWLFFSFSIFYIIFFDMLSLNKICYSLLFSTIAPLMFLLSKHRSIMISFKKNEKINFDKYYDFTRVCFFLMLINMLFFLDETIFYWITKSQLGSDSVADITVIFKICSIVLIPLNVIEVITPNYIAKLYSENKKKLIYFVRKISTYKLISGSLLIIPVMIFSENIILIIFGNKFVELTQLVRLISFSYFTRVFFGTSAQILLLSDNAKVLLILRSFSLIFTFFIFLSVELNFNQVLFLSIFYRSLIDILSFGYVFINLKINSLPYLKIKDIKTIFMEDIFKK